MRRVVWVATIAIIAASSTAQQKQPGFAQPSWTWAQVVQGAADNPKTVPHRPLAKEVTPYSYREDVNNLNKYDEKEQFQNKNDYEYEYLDDEQFNNDEYVYVDDIEDVENPEQFQFKEENENRRVLDFLYHTFAEPVLQPNQPAQPSLIGEVFRTIDNHINKDFTSLANLVAQGSATANPIPAQQPVQTYGTPGQRSGTPVATSIASGPTGDDLLVTDDLGNQHLVSVDDIVQSLSVLDERSLVDLILAPEGADPELSIQLPVGIGNTVNRSPDLPATQTASAPLNSFQLPAPAPAPLPVPVAPTSASPPSGGLPIPSASLPSGGVPVPFVSPSSGGVPLPNPQTNVVDTSQIVILPGQLTKAIRNFASASQGGEVFRPVRHTGPVNTATADNEESFLITDEQGNVQVITMNDILSSLSSLDQDTITDLLQDTSAASQIVSSPTPANTLINIPGSASVSASVSTFPLHTGPLIETDFEGNVHIRPSQPGSNKVELNDHTAENNKVKQPSVPAVQISTSAPPPPSPSQTKNTTVMSSDGTFVSTDQKGNIYITPDPDKPFTIDIQNIIRLAEQAEQGQTKEDRASEFSGAILNQLQSAKKTTTNTPTTPAPARGNEILAYLAGDDFLPNPILPGPIRSATPKQPVQPPVPDFRSALLNSLGIRRQPEQQATPSPATPGIGATFLNSLGIRRQPGQQTNPSPATPGIGAQFSGLLSQIVNQAAQVVVPQPETPPISKQENEVIQLVIREQFEDGGENTFGTINVPLPQSIHHSQRVLQKQQQQEIRNSGDANGAQRRIYTANWNEGLPTNVVNAVLRGMQREVKFDPSKAIRAIQG
ncbi:unnamed protein product [Meganyctiphanes norvegica]|uniref:Uncharacterized protein n=1 Tax=Meganyctiphanes norvegica TaxID=48144 RepID=A0AAV2PKC0_MEGNR